jgi:ubiquinone/menaquinone biosynthesis C-methylase UbiE
MAEQETSEQLAARFDARAATYDESEMHRLLASSVAEFVDIAGVRDVLDAATGTGLILRVLRPRLGDDARFTGVDLSRGMLEIARGRTPGATFVEGDATRLPFADSSFDLITCVTGIHLMPDAVTALREWARVLRPRGRMVIATFTSASAMTWGHVVTLSDEAPAAGLTVLRSSEWPAQTHSKFPDLEIAELAATTG